MLINSALPEFAMRLRLVVKYATQSCYKHTELILYFGIQRAYHVSQRVFAAQRRYFAVFGEYEAEVFVLKVVLALELGRIEEKDPEEELKAVNLCREIFARAFSPHFLLFIVEKLAYADRQKADHIKEHEQTEAEKPFPQYERQRPHEIHQENAHYG